MFEILMIIPLIGIAVFSVLIYLNWREEAKKEGIIYDGKRNEE